MNGPSCLRTHSAFDVLQLPAPCLHRCIAHREGVLCVCVRVRGVRVLSVCIVCVCVCVHAVTRWYDITSALHVHPQPTQGFARAAGPTPNDARVYTGSVASESSRGNNSLHAVVGDDGAAAVLSGSRDHSDGSHRASLRAPPLATNTVSALAYHLLWKVAQTVSCCW